VQNPWNPIFSQAGLVTDLSSRGLDTSDWLPNPLLTAQYQGKLFGVPFRMDALALIWNKDVFQAAGLDPEKPPGDIHLGQ
jgi:multiple sugar transport system substrate-binding protein